MTKIYIETAGCSHNFADSEQMAGLLKQAQFELIKDIEDADIIIFNTCLVKTPTEMAFFKRLKQVKEEYPYKIIIIAGCIAQISQKKLKKYPLIGTKQIHKVVEVVEETLNENTIKALDMSEMPPLNTPRVRKNPIVSIIPISRGCLGACSFCITKAARGHLVSYLPKEILKEVRQAVGEGIKEIWLTSQDTGCYGFDINTNLPNLLNEIVQLPHDFKIRIGMMNPNNLLKIQDNLIKVYKSPKIFKFLHVPVQSGSNKVLKSMRRGYKVEDYINLVNRFKKKIPKITIATDIIVGFPTETEEQYWDTLNLIRKTIPEIVNISRFWPRPKTTAAKIRPLQGDVVKHRSKVLSDICQNISKMQNERWIGWEGEILINEKGKKENQWLGKNSYYKQVLIEGDFRLGQIFKVRIYKVTNYDLRGEVII